MKYIQVFLDMFLFSHRVTTRSEYWLKTIPFLCGMLLISYFYLSGFMYPDAPQSDLSSHIGVFLESLSFVSFSAIVFLCAYSVLSVGLFFCITGVYLYFSPTILFSAIDGGSFSFVFPLLLLGISTGVLFLWFFVLFIQAMIGRYKTVGKSAWWGLLFFIPVLNIFQLVELGFEKKSNK